jgi:aryl-alcohol dehydrogenase-like predicted oxidoreductase
MPSIRPPLLQAQLDQAFALMPTMRPDLILLEDMDLGLRGISEINRNTQLENTVKWLDKLCADGAAGAWGISLYNSNAHDAQALVAQITEFAADNHFFSAIGLRAAQLKPERWVEVSKKLPLVLLVNTQVELQWVREKMPGATVLLNWNSVIQNGLSADATEATC